MCNLPGENELISSIVGNTKGITLIEVKKKLVKEYQRLEKKNMARERAFKVNTERAKGGQGHMKRGCPVQSSDGEDDAVFGWVRNALRDG
ncbi:hypothetical protein PF004_g11478 [Phytophthora fragariae]|uniref:Uncharacterized protein n=1 Tax=Phytophthora fragariae TaxID=53985 RepID=A0A6G0NY10_9STRA|nr:hypothetical protein PF004_g11478 [Phytophthora fragariae]